MAAVLARSSRLRGLGGVHEFTGTICPLTPLENHFRRLAGEAGYTGGFVEHYVWSLIYPPGLTRGVQTGLGLLVVSVNVVALPAALAMAEGRPDLTADPIPSPAHRR